MDGAFVLSDSTSPLIGRGPKVALVWMYNWCAIRLKGWMSVFVPWILKLKRSERPLVLLVCPSEPGIKGRSHFMPASAMTVLNRRHLVAENTTFPVYYVDEGYRLDNHGKSDRKRRRFRLGHSCTRRRTKIWYEGRHNPSMNCCKRFACSSYWYFYGGLLPWKQQQSLDIKRSEYEIHQRSTIDQTFSRAVSI